MVTTPISTQEKMKLNPTPLRETGTDGLTLSAVWSRRLSFTEQLRDSRHQHGAPRVGDAAPSRGGGVLVVPQGAAEQPQVVESQDQDHHAAEGDAANPPGKSQEAARGRLTLRHLTATIWLIQTFKLTLTT